ncbi:MAG TPA: AzlC family ABC transporter permease [Microvirga sp.]|nr:AzlC family ABC transporter permease [Microvirga sp.]
MPAPTRPSFTLAGFLRGARYSLPLWPGIVVFGSAFGAAAVQKGLTFAETMAMSAFVYAGASQMVALEIWPQVWTPANIVGTTAVVAVINARMILMGAAIQPWLKGEPKARTALNLFFLTDANWLIGTGYHAGGGRDVGVLFGAGVVIWVVWVLGTLPGYFAGALIPDPGRFGLDLIMPIFFAVMLSNLWKGWRPARPWVVAGIVAFVVHILVPGYGFILAGALAGAVAGAVLE